MSEVRLIDAEALKKALIEAHINRVLTFDIATFNCVMNTIDNAPTPLNPTVITCNTLSNEEAEKLIKTIQSARIVPDYLQGWRYEETPQASNNAELFKQTFGIYATELWTMSEADFLKWLNAEVDK